MLKNKFKKSIVIPVAVTAIITALGVGALSYANATKADTSTGVSTQKGDHQGPRPMGQRPAAVGVVTAINGSAITITSMGDPHASTTPTAIYTVDASAAKIERESTEVTGATTGSGMRKPPTPTTILVSDIKVGDMLMIQGTVSGSSIVATNIFDGKFGGHLMGKGQGFGGPGGPGKGGPHGPRDGITGTVSSVNGTSITVTGKEGRKNSTTAAATVFTVDASTAKFMKSSNGNAPATASISDILTGDTVMVHGTITGNSVAAKEIFDGVPPTRPMRGPAGQPKSSS